LKKGHMEIPVWIATSDLVWAEQEARALNFWSTKLDMNWYAADKPESCALAFVDGNAGFMEPDTIGIARLPGWKGFQGLTAANLSMSGLTPEERFRNAAHELGHVFGLSHNNNAASLMNPYNVGSYKILDETDLAALAKLHALRPGTPLKVVVVSGTIPEQDLAELVRP
jgi:Matrixin